MCVTADRPGFRPPSVSCWVDQGSVEKAGRAAPAHRVKSVLGTLRGAQAILVCVPRVPVRTETHGQPPTMTDRSSLTAHQSPSLLTARYSPHLCKAVLQHLRKSLTAPVAHQDQTVSRPMPVPAHDRVQIGTSRTTRRHPTSTNITRRSRKLPPVPTIKALADVLPAALYQQTHRNSQAKHALAGQADLRDG